jgi:hypothetical protein
MQLKYNLQTYSLNNAGRERKEGARLQVLRWMARHQRGQQRNPAGPPPACTSKRCTCE